MNIQIKKLEQKDVNKIAEYANNKKIWLNVSNGFPHPYKKEHAIEFIKEVSKQNPLQTFKISVENKFAGIMTTSPKENIYFKNAEIGYWIAEPYWNKGFGTQAVKLILEYTFETFTQIEKICARVYHYNVGSMKVLLKNGFEKEAIIEKAAFKAGQYVDIHHFRIFKNDFYKL
ncbi:MAG: GNAT family N-acetyltransferase [Bacteroidales bacterium]|nr:GNAT family N-acetyltransferase [Bacteroidales bacterium]